MVSDGGHDVAEVQGSDGATFVVVLLCKRLAGMFQLQLLQQHTHTHKEGGVKLLADKEGVPMMRSITREQRSTTSENESVIMSELDGCESPQMSHCQTVALVITTVSLETNGNHVPRSLILESGLVVLEAAGRCVPRKMIQCDNNAIRWGFRGTAIRSPSPLSELISYNHRITEQRLCNNQRYFILHRGSYSLISGDYTSQCLLIISWKTHDDTLLCQKQKTFKSAKVSNNHKVEAKTLKQI